MVLLLADASARDETGAVDGHHARQTTCEETVRMSHFAYESRSNTEFAYIVGTAHEHRVCNACKPSYAYVVLTCEHVIACKHIVSHIVACKHIVLHIILLYCILSQ